VAVELLGERSLRIEELEADISEMKAIFQAQMDEAAHQLDRLQRAASGAAAAGGPGGSSGGA
jgi:hypothetical protein